MKTMATKHVFIIGSKGIPAAYGGYETFVDRLTFFRQSGNIQYHVACLARQGSPAREGSAAEQYNGADCFTVGVPDIGPAKAVLYDLKALRYTCKKIQSEQIKDAVVYILACRIGPFAGRYHHRLAKLGAKLYINPDGHEWKRSKWNSFIKKYWKLSERLMVKNSDLMVCDSRSIEEYIRREYADYQPKTTFIAYGADTGHSTAPDDAVSRWNREHEIRPGEYFLVVGRFVPENNLETIIREFMKSKTEKDLVIISNVEQNRFYEVLKKNTGFSADRRVKFVGTVYDQELLKRIRREAFAYIHGHEVGGTNPSLLEALASTRLNILLDVSFNREVARDAALYFDKGRGSLTSVIEESGRITENELMKYGRAAVDRIESAYSWGKIVCSYETLFLTGKECSGQPQPLSGEQGKG